MPKTSHADDDARDLITLLEDSGQEPYAYSGRAMYGATCVAFDVERGASVFEAIGEMISTIDDNDTLRALLAEAVSDIRTDSMGLDTVVYFPRFPMERNDVPADEDGRPASREVAP